MDLKVRQTNFQNGDHRWLGSSHGTEDADTVTVDLSTFDFVTNFPNGFLPSGVLLGKITATGRYGLYAGNANEVQRITVDATSGTFTVTFDGATSGAVAFNASPAAFQALLEAMPTINPGDVVVSGGPGSAGGATPYLLTFGGRYAGANVPAVTTTGTLAGGAATAVPFTVTQGGSAAVDGRQVPAGQLLNDIQVPADNVAGVALGSLFWHGEVITAVLPANANCDANAQLLLNRIRYV